MQPTQGDPGMSGSGNQERLHFQAPQDTLYMMPCSSRPEDVANLPKP